MMSNPNGKGLVPIADTIDDQYRITLQGMDQKRLGKFKKTF